MEKSNNLKSNMFECNQAISLLHHALVSAARDNSRTLRDLGDSKEKSLNIVAKSLKTIVDHSIDGIFDESSEYSLKCIEVSEYSLKIIEVELHVNQQLHAAVFFNTLRSYGITCDSSNNFYESISHGWPELDFEFYVELNYKQKWSDFFIKCASQLPSDILVLVLKYILRASFESDVRYYSWHLILQTIILKLLNLPGDNIPECSFDFDFESETSPPTADSLDTEFADSEITDDPNILINMAIISVEDIFNLLCDMLRIDVKQSNDINLIKVLLQASKTLIKSKASFSNKELLKVYAILIECLQLSPNIYVLKTAINNYSCQNIDHAFATSAWSIPENYLILIINYYYLSLSIEEVLNLKNLECSEILSFLPVILQDINPYTLSNFYHQNDQHLELLYKIIQLNFEGASYAAEILLSNPTLLENDRTLSILEENTSAIDIVNIYSLILESVIAVKSEDFNVRLLKFFYKVLSENSTEIYNDVLKHIVLSYGFTENFQLPDFDTQLSLFVRQTSDEKQADNVLLSLFVQSPKATLRCVITEVLCKGQDGKPLIQVLKLIPEACMCLKDLKDTTPLIEILQQYIESDNLEVYESRNFAALFQFLMEVHLETEILHVDLFMNQCIIPSLKRSDRLELILNCLRVILHSLNVKEEILKEKNSSSENSQSLINRSYDISSDTLKVLVSVIAQLISCSIESGSGRLKESLILIFNAFESYQINTQILKDNDKLELQAIFAPLNETVQVYGKEFLPPNIDFKNLPSMWIWCCKTTDFAFIDEEFAKEIITFPELLNTFTQLMPHFTTDEWKFSVMFASKLSKYSYFIEDVIQYSDVPFQLLDNEKSMYAVISCFITSLHFTLPDKINESLYASTCFCNSLKNILKEEKVISSQLILAIFLDICYLLNCIKSNLISTFSSVLFELKDRLPLCADKSTESDCQKLISLTLKCLPESLEKTDLLQKMKILE